MNFNKNKQSTFTIKTPQINNNRQRRCFRRKMILQHNFSRIGELQSRINKAHSQSKNTQINENRYR